MLQPSTIKFLKDLKKNNNKPWFDANRPVYETAKKDYEKFVQTIIDKHGKKDPSIKDLTPRDCMFRINRDVRFSKDKSPYKTNFGAFFVQGGKKSPLAGYYFHCSPGDAFIGGGLWMPMPPELKKVRQEIDYCFDEFKKIVSSKKFRSAYGDIDRSAEYTLSRLPKEFEKGNPAEEYLKMKSYVATQRIDDKDLTSTGLVKKVTDAFEALQPMLMFINRAIE
ncbi:MAG: DUF2461 domain-containing protein [Bacteroidetes bacterium]|nr:DUF2461 domain-containing protein [Bacteroidota bacterium]